MGGSIDRSERPGKKIVPPATEAAVHKREEDEEEMCGGSTGTTVFAKCEETIAGTGMVRWVVVVAVKVEERGRRCAGMESTHYTVQTRVITLLPNCIPNVP